MEEIVAESVTLDKTRVQSPANSTYSKPPLPSELQDRMLDYVVVQVSANRYAVAEFQACYTRTLCYVIVTGRMNFKTATIKAGQLKNARIRPID